MREQAADETKSAKSHFITQSPSLATSSLFFNKHLSPEVLEFIDQRVHTRTPSEIYQGLLDSTNLDIEHVAQHQVYYRWQQLNAGKWKKDPDAFKSVLAEAVKDYIQFRYVPLREHAWICRLCSFDISSTYILERIGDGRHVWYK